MNRQFDNKRQSLTVTDKQAGIGNFTGHMFNMKLEEKSPEISFKALPFKISGQKTETRNRCRPVELKQIMERAYQLM